MADDLAIRHLESDDTDRIEEIAVEAWESAYEQYLENLGEELFDARFEGDWRAYKASQVREQCQRKPEQVLVATVEESVVGFVTFTVDEETAIGTIGNNAVDPAFQGRGIATKLYETVLEEFRERGLQFAQVSTGLEEAYAPARRAYEKVGFDITRETVTYWREL